MKCKRCTGEGLREFLKDFAIENADRIVTIDEMQKLSREYCRTYCPVSKFERKYAGSRE